MINFIVLANKNYYTKLILILIKLIFNKAQLLYLSFFNAELIQHYVGFTYNISNSNTHLILKNILKTYLNILDTKVIKLMRVI